MEEGDKDVVTGVNGHVNWRRKQTATPAHLLLTAAAIAAPRSSPYRSWRKWHRVANNRRVMAASWRQRRKSIGRAASLRQEA